MFTNLRPFVAFVVAPVVLIVASLVAVPFAAAQPGRFAPPREARGTVKSVDAKARVVVVTTFEPGQAPGDKPFTLAKNAEIALGDGTPRRGAYRAGTLDDVVAGASVTLTLSDDEKSVTSLLAQGPLVRGVLKKIDAAKRQLEAEVGPTARDSSAEVRTYKLVDGAEIGVDDGRGRRFSVREAKLADLVAGAPVSLQLSADQKEVLSIVAEGTGVSGTVKSVDADGKKLTLTAAPSRPGEEPGEQTLDVADDALVLLDDGRGRRLSVTAGKLADVPPGSQVRVRLSPDQKQAVQIAAEGPNQFAVVKGVDAEKGTITVALLSRGGGEPEEKTFDVDVEARIIVDNQAAKLGDVKPAENGPWANLRLSLDQKTVRALSIIVNR